MVEHWHDWICNACGAEVRREDFHATEPAFQEDFGVIVAWPCGHVILHGGAAGAHGWKPGCEPPPGEPESEQSVLFSEHSEEVAE